MCIVMDSSDLAAPFRKKAGRIGCVLLHGFTGTPYSLRNLGDALYSRDITVYAPLLPGHGTKPKDMVGISYLQWIEICRQAINEIKKNCDNVFIIGLSMGGTIALYLASELQVNGIVCLSTPIEGSCFVGPFYSLLKHIVRYWPKWRSFLKPYRSELGYRWYPCYAIDMFVVLLRETRSRLSKVNCPVLLMHSKNDKRVSCKHMKLIFNEIGTQNKETIMLNTRKHAITLGEEKRKIIRAVVSFIEKYKRGD